MADSESLVVFSLDEQDDALALAAVLRVVRVVALAPLPQVPAIVLGVIVLGDTVVPVVSLRRRFGLAERELELSDQPVVARTPRRQLALLVDRASRLDDGLVLIHALDRLLSLDEEVALDTALGETTGGRDRS